MNIIEHVTGFSMQRIGLQISACLLSLALLFASWPQRLGAYQDTPAPARAIEAPARMQQSAEQLQRLVAPIALYPDSLVSQILAASTFPEQVVEADRWLVAHPDLKGGELAKAVDQQAWDLGIKALTAFPSVLGNMDKNLSWTSSLGDAYYNQQAEVMEAVQAMRQRAQQAGSLKTTPQQTVTTQSSTIVVEPASPEVVYVPAYDPWLVYGDPILEWPGWCPYPGIWFGGPYLSFGFGFGIGWFGGYGWGWGNWGFNWHDRYATFGHDRYYSRSSTFYNRSNFYRDRGAREFGGERGGARSSVHAGNRVSNENGGVRGANEARSGVTAKPFSGDRQATRGYAEPGGQSGVRSGAFGGYSEGGQTRGFSSRGSESFGGGGFGGGGFHGGGGGGRR